MKCDHSTQYILLESSGELKPADRLAFSREIARASSERDKALACLHLDRDAKDAMIDALYALPAPAPKAEPEEKQA